VRSYKPIACACRSSRTRSIYNRKHPTHPHRPATHTKTPMASTVEPTARDLKVTSFKIYGDVSTTQQKQRQGQKQEPPRSSLIRRLGKSSEGIVNLAKSVTTGQLRAMKIVKADKVEAPIEARMLGAVGRHPNVLSCFEAEHHPNGGVAIMCMEFCSLGDLRRIQVLLLEQKLQTPAALVLKVLIDVSEGLALIHGGWTRSSTSGSYRLTRQNHQSLVHRDIKPENIFVRPSVGGRQLPLFVIGDFGQAFPTIKAHNSGGNGAIERQSSTYTAGHHSPLRLTSIHSA
jgi:serine/threonine protein kinase